MARYKRYWFSTADFEIVGNDVVAGNVRPAKKVAQQIANEIGKAVCVNCGEDIIDWVYPE